MKFNNIFEAINSLTEGNIPIIIPTHDNQSYLLNTINFFKNKKHNCIIVLDNNSKTNKMKLTLAELENDVMVVYQENNAGPRQFLTDSNFFNALPNIFILTDPDLGFSNKIPENFCQELIEISNIHSAGKVGCALNIDIKEENMVDDIIIVNGAAITVRGVEQNYFAEHLGDFNGNPIYNAPIDTTFALYNKNQSLSKSVSVAGNYMAEHYGWYRFPPIPQEEIEDYLNSLEGDVVTYGGLTETVKRYGKY